MDQERHPINLAATHRAAGGTRRRGGRAFAAAAGLAGLAVTGCTSTAGLPLAPPEPAVGAVPGPEQTTPYRIQVGDVLSVKLPLSPELNDDVVVLPDGHISTSVVDYERAQGRTVPEMTQVLRNDYKKLLLKPDLTVIVKTPSPCRIYVAGEVATPGEYAGDCPAPTLAQAIARAGGVRPTGDSSRVVILRHDSDGAHFYATHFGALMNASEPAADVRLERQDIVYVPRTGIANVYVAFNQYIQQFLPISWGFSYQVNPTPTFNNSTGSTK
jgi:polysaccharide export outer membrane protein